ncbi:hypothetical protein QUF76_06460 [Desulfobacterales bacterium HSG16]|nr:hypothetical protein [Desulfobacterales bacterium HSG16]
MRIDDENPVFRKAFIPWYDSETICLVFIMFLFTVALFAAAGISVAMPSPDFHTYIWLPVLLLSLSSFVILSITIRLIKRYMHTGNKEQ